MTFHGVCRSQSLQEQQKSIKKNLFQFNQANPPIDGKHHKGLDLRLLLPCIHLYKPWLKHPALIANSGLPN